MKIETIDIIDHPLEPVYTALRDHLQDMVPFLPEVEAIEVLERVTPSPGTLRLLNRWQGQPDTVPKVVRPFLKRELIGFKDHATWDDEQHRVEWRFESLVGDRYFECSGANTFRAVTDRQTEIVIRGELTVYPERFPGVPRFLAKKVKPMVEEYLIHLITPNLASLAKGVAGYLLAQAGSST